MSAANPVGNNQFTILIQGAGNPSPATIGLIGLGDTVVLAMRTANAGPRQFGKLHGMYYPQHHNVLQCGMGYRQF